MRDIFDFLGQFLMFIAVLILGFVILAGIGLAVYGIYDFFKSPEQREKDRQQDVYEATPHVYSQVDGCTVYTWKANGNHHYFTRCGNKVTTEGNRSESCGKGCSKNVKEIIVTEEK